MNRENLLERSRKYVSLITGSKENHDKNKVILSAVSGLLSIFFIVTNYFNYLRASDKHTWKGILFFFLSVAYFFFCLWLYIEQVLLNPATNK